MSCSLSSEAYQVLFLHSCRYHHRQVNGLLVGTVSDGRTHVTKTLPLFHSSLALLPMLEVALMLADEHCEQEKLQIVGYYQANEVAEDFELGPFGKKISDKIRSNLSSGQKAAVFLLDGGNMHPTPDDLRLVSLAADGKLEEAPTLENAEQCLQNLEGCAGPPRAARPSAAPSRVPPAPPAPPHRLPLPSRQAAGQVAPARVCRL